MSLAAMMDLASMAVERADHVGLRLSGRLSSWQTQTAGGHAHDRRPDHAEVCSPQARFPAAPLGAFGGREPGPG